MATRNSLDGSRARLFARIRSASLPSRLAVVVGGLSLASVIMTYVLQTGYLHIQLSPNRLIALLVLNFALAMTLAALMVWRLVRLWREQRSGVAGATLHVRLVTMFSAIAVVPLVLAAVFTAVTLNLGVQAWFSTRVQAALGGAVGVAEHYEKDRESLMKNDALAVASKIAHDQSIISQGHANESLLFAKLHDLVDSRGLLAAYIFDGQGNVLGSATQPGASDALRNPKPPLLGDLDLTRAQPDLVIIDANSHVGVMRALKNLPEFRDAFLMVVRPIDPVVLQYYQTTLHTVHDYDDLSGQLAKVQIILAALYILVSLLVLLVAVWLGIWAAEELVEPISRLIIAAQAVSKGDLKAQVPITRGDDELARLGQTFNRMTSQLQAQRNELVEASHQIDARRRFMEAVLSGVSAGVIGLDADGMITLVNRAAARLLNADPEEMEGHHYAETVPELGALIRRAMQEPVGRAGGEVAVKRAGAPQTLSVQVDSDTAGSYVVTFDDITDLVSAQRTAAWADVARRIAHEIKNPLTPIQLSAERLKRKYGKEVSTDPEIFAQCTDTIIRQVGDIGRMVDEFSSFARMPAPVMRPENYQELLQQSVFLQRVGNPQITFDIVAPADPVRIVCDGRLLSQALTNILKNAAEAVASRQATGDDTEGRITVALTVKDERACLAVTDNGIGLPAENRNRLTEPYVTTRAKGTGLGLAIVRKIIEDHGGEIALNDRDDDCQGAVVRFGIPLAKRAPRTTEVEGQYEQERIADLA